MAHELSMKDGKAEMAYSGEQPWHGLGTRVDGLATPREMVKHAGLEWEVETVKLASVDGAPVPGFVGIRRQDTQVFLGVATERYTPIQNVQASEVMDALISEGQATVEVCGALGQGERCWMLSVLPEEFEVVRGDVVKPYVLLAWGHDGKHGLAAKLTPIRVVCNNTLSMALGKKWSKNADVYVKHTASAKVQLEAAQKALGIIRRQTAKTQEAYKLLAATPMNEVAAHDYFVALQPEPERVEGDESYESKLARWNKVQDSLLALYEGGKGVEIPGVAGTAWAGYNAVTEHVDHVYPVLQSGEVSKVREQSVLFGAYADLKQRALASALEFAEKR